ncbi:MAG: electron transport complex subunit RsxC [Gammaproteobacteria bacterium]|nr:electron transport complex subunit RsxC [Gammaproteobacteria bacterium]
MSSTTKLYLFHGGLRLDGHKQISNQSPIATCKPQNRYVIPVQQHIGAAGDIIVEKGQRVLKGQMLATTKILISAPIHSPVSGTVIEIGKHAVPHPSGMETDCIIIENDFQDEWIRRNPVAENYHQMNSHDLRNIVRNAGIVGLGGAVFPAAIKQTETNIRTLILNGVECEPYITCDDKLMQERAREIISGADIIGHIIKARECIVAIEDNKPEAIAAIQAAIDEDSTGFFHLQIIPTKYPSGSEKQLIKIITGKEVPINGLPADIDLLCHNVGTAYAIHQAVFKDEPLISRVVSITGNGVKQPQNMEVPIGTYIADCVTQCGGYNDNASCMIMGGPMMGYSIHSDHLPVVKATNCLLVTSNNEIHPANTEAHLPCIRCAKCVEVCPAKLLPQQLYWYASTNNFERASEYHLFDCIECGCCSYVCPSQIPLVQYYRSAKSKIWELEADLKKSNAARKRHEARQFRLEQQKREREERLRQKREMLNTKKGRPEENEINLKKAAIAEALARVKQKKETQAITPKNTDNLTAEQLRQIKEADQRRQAMKKKNHE